MLAKPDIAPAGEDLGGVVAGSVERDGEWERGTIRAWIFSEDGVAEHHCARVAELDRDRVNEVDWFIGDRFLLAARGQRLSFRGSGAERAALALAEISRDPAYLLYIVLDELTAEFAPVQKAIGTMIEHLENEALAMLDNDLVNSLVMHKRFVCTATRFFSQHSFMFHGSMWADVPFVSRGRPQAYSSELAGRFSTVATVFDDTRPAVLGTFDISMPGLAYRTNGVVKTLTIISILLLPATAICGLFGTSFGQPPLFGTGGFITMVGSLGR